ncbi:ribonuclease H [Raphidocelis subcapitata]|uniref:Ribonuclease H n=1 Tax=Raphidocelis subcapitata TaxID=307507 RepID=A0A2V0PBU5_9CHLO|nr:ribonuclease H [Raphidocelis subcapitata]|eukprot:GBF96402.1 ribonuclease H [Raphidocelis subcapitata]
MSLLLLQGSQLLLEPLRRQLTAALAAAPAAARRLCSAAAAAPPAGGGAPPAAPGASDGTAASTSSGAGAGSGSRSSNSNSGAMPSTAACEGAPPAPSAAWPAGQRAATPPSPPSASDAAQQPLKSARRMAAEALLAARFVGAGQASPGAAASARGGGSGSGGGGGARPSPPRLKSASLAGGGSVLLSPQLLVSLTPGGNGLSVARPPRAALPKPAGTSSSSVSKRAPAASKAAATASATEALAVLADLAAQPYDGVAPAGEPVAVAACDASCSHPNAQGWCHMPVHVPHVDWEALMASEPATFSNVRVAPGYDRLTLPYGLQVLVVENPLYLADAIKRLRASMRDPVLAIDLEWRPAFGPRFTPVAMVQIASARLALLVRTCRMQYRLAPELQQLLQDPSVRLLGFGWDTADESKMQGTFSIGSASFPGFLDLQEVARGLGWHGYGLARLTKAVLGTPLPKSRKVTMSNWECRVLTRAQIKYAALDVLIAGQVFRGLRLWHRSPSPCASCLQPLGALQPPPSLSCGAAECGRGFGGNVQAYFTHCRSTGHAMDFGECPACGCLRPMEAIRHVEPEPWAAESAIGAIGPQAGEKRTAEAAALDGGGGGGGEAADGAEGGDDVGRGGGGGGDQQQQQQQQQGEEEEPGGGRPAKRRRTEG